MADATENESKAKTQAMTRQEELNRAEEADSLRRWLADPSFQNPHHPSRRR